MCILSFKSWEINTLSSKIIQTEKAKSSHFDRTRGDKKQIFPTLGSLKNLGLIGNFFRLLLETLSSSLVWLILAEPSKKFRSHSKILGHRRHNNLGLISNFFPLLLETFSSSLIWLILAKPSKKFRSFSKILGNRRHNNYLGHLNIYVLIHNWISIQFWVWGRRK